MDELKELPKGWEFVKISSVTDINPKLPENDISDDMIVSFLPMKCVEAVSNKIILTEKKKYSEVKKGFTPMIDGDVIFAKITPCMENGKIAVVRSLINKIAFGSTEFHVFRCCSAINNYFLFYYLVQEKTRQLASYNMTGAVGQRRVPKKFLEEFNIPLPPLAEQHRIVARIEELFSSLDKGIESLKTAQLQLKTYRQAVLKWAFEGKLTNENVKENELPTGWTWESLVNLVEKISDGPFGSHLKTSDYVDSGVRVIRLENIGPLEFRNNYRSFVTEEKYETIKNHTVLRGDIIFSSFISERIRTAILPGYIDKAINKADCFLVRSNEKKVNNKYLVYFFATKSMYHQLIGNIHGSTRPRINTGQLKATQIPVAPIPEQHRIVSEIETRLSVCDKLEESISQSLVQAEALRQSILKKAFEGKLVPQDPNDEPASVLLERIRAEREKNQPVKKGRRK